MPGSDPGTPLAMEAMKGPIGTVTGTSGNRPIRCSTERLGALPVTHCLPHAAAYQTKDLLSQAFRADLNPIRECHALTLNSIWSCSKPSTAVSSWTLRTTMPLIIITMVAVGPRRTRRTPLRRRRRMASLHSKLCWNSTTYVHIRMIDSCFVFLGT